MGIGIGAIAGGIRQGLKDYRENMRGIEKDERDEARFKMEQERFGLEKERLGRETERFGWEKKQEEERQRIRDAEAEYRKADEDLRSGRLLGPDALVQQPTAIAAPGSEPAAQQIANPYLSGAEKYKDPAAALDKYYEAKGNALAKLYNAKGEFDRAEKVPSMIRALRQEQWTEKTGHAFSKLGSGAPDALESMSKVYGMVSDGYELDPTKGKFDPKTGSWSGLERVRTKDGSRESFGLTPEQILTMSARYKDPGEIIRFNLERGDKARQEVRENKKVENDTIRAEADRTKANALSAHYADSSKTNASVRETNADIRRREQERRDDESALRRFADAFGYKEVQVKTDKELEALSPDEIKGYARARQEQERRREAVNFANSLYSLNDRKIQPSVITQLIPVLQRRAKEGKPADGIDESTGLPFINFNGKKVLLQKD